MSNQTTDLVSVVEEFKKDISTGGANNGNLPGPLPNGYREVDWDTVGLGYGIIQNSMLYVSTPAFSTLVSGHPDTGSNFSKIESSYENTFKPFSPPSLLAVFAGPGPVTLAFRSPAAPITPLAVNGIGIVLSDVDLPDISFLAINTVEGDYFRIPISPAPGNGNFSFVGARFDKSVILEARVGLGNAGLIKGSVDGAIRSTGVLDLVAMDNVIFGEPQAIPEPSTLSIILAFGAVILLASVLHR